MTLKTFGGCDQRLLDCYDADEGASAEDKVFVAELMIKVSDKPRPFRRRNSTA
ncbi:hypothetical protein GOC27_02665 [Sinorhizobium meliloti]|nr:hypothetical protein [Sinorhizobium meliloti]